MASPSCLHARPWAPGRPGGSHAFRNSFAACARRSSARPRHRQRLRRRRTSSDRRRACSAGSTAIARIPSPTRCRRSCKAVSHLGLFRDMETAGVYVGFMAGVIEANPKRAEALIAKMFPMPPEDQVAIVRAIAHSGHPEWKELLGKFSERMPARKVLIDRFITGKQPTLAADAARHRRRPARHAVGPVFRHRLLRAGAAHGLDPRVVQGRQQRRQADGRQHDQADARHQRLARQGAARHAQGVDAHETQGDARGPARGHRRRRDLRVRPRAHAMRWPPSISSRSRALPRPATRSGGARPARRRWRWAASLRAPWGISRWAYPASSAAPFPPPRSSTWCPGSSRPGRARQSHHCKGAGDKEPCFAPQHHRTVWSGAFAPIWYTSDDRSADRRQKSKNSWEESYVAMLRAGLALAAAAALSVPPRRRTIPRGP